MASKTSATTLRALTPEQREHITSEGERIFAQKVPDKEKRQHHGRYIAIDVTDGRYAFGETMSEADELLLPLPEGHFVYLQRIGLPFRAPRSIRLRGSVRS